MPKVIASKSFRIPLLLAVVLVCGSVFVLSRSGSSAAADIWLHETHPQTAWAACNLNARNGKPSTFHPLSDAAAATLVTRQPEIRPDNARSYTLAGVRYPAPNDYVPNPGQLEAFRNARNDAGQTNVEFNPYYQYVDGRDGISRPSTDDLIQWAAHKWGIPEDWLRAEYIRESYWNQYMLGDATSVSAARIKLYPPQSRIGHSNRVYQSLGITQVQFAPFGTLHPGTEPLRWLSTAFNIDYQAATLRFYYDNPQGSRSAWNDSSYTPCQAWRSLGGWYSPFPWGNAPQARYVSQVQHILATRGWEASDFVNWSPPSLPPGIRFK